MKHPITRALLYLLCLYDIYLYLPDTLDLFGIDFYPPETDALLYFDAAMLLIGGLAIGWLLRRCGGRFNTRFRMGDDHDEPCSYTLVYMESDTIAPATPQVTGSLVRRFSINLCYN